MNLKQLRAKFQELMGRIKELRETETRSDEQSVELAAKVVEAQDVRAKIESLEKEEREIAELDAFDNTPATRAATGTQGANPAGSQGRESTGRRVGTDLVSVDLRIGGRAVDHEGFGIPERAFNLARESSYSRAYWNAMCGRADKADLALLNEVQNLVRSWDTGLIDADGGYFTPPQFFAEIVGPDAYPSGLLDEVRTLPINGRAFQMLRNTYTGSDIYNSPYRKDRTSGLSGPTEQSGPHLGLLEVPMHESFIKVPVPRSMLEDSIVSVMAYVQEQMRDTYRLGTESELTNGTGVGQPQGILTDAGGTDEVGTYNVGATPDADRWVKLYREVPPMYRPNAKLVIADAAYQLLEGLEDANGAFPFAVLNLTTSAGTNGPAERYRGKEIIPGPFYPDYESAAKVGSWGDHRRAYYYGLRMGATMGVRNIADESFVTFVMRVRDGGKVVLPQALKVAVASAP